MAILVTGGAGYIGSHTVIELISNGYDVVIVDNLCNSKINVLDRIEMISGVRVKFYEIDCCDKEKMRTIFENEKIDGVIHFAGLKAVGESVQIPMQYYRNNLVSTLNLIDLMEKYGCDNLVFSSSIISFVLPYGFVTCKSKCS